MHLHLMMKNYYIPNIFIYYIICRRSRSASTDRNSFRGDKPISKDSRPLGDKRFQYEAYNLVNYFVFIYFKL